MLHSRAWRADMTDMTWLCSRPPQVQPPAGMARAWHADLAASRKQTQGLSREAAASLRCGFLGARTGKGRRRTAGQRQTAGCQPGGGCSTG